VSAKYKSPFGLNASERQRARDIAVYAAMMGYHHRSQMIYTELAPRWSGIDDHRLGWKGEFPRGADCSAFYTWCLWNAFEHFHIHEDAVNGADWREGYTGTMVQHGIQVGFNQLLPGDAIFYGGSHSVPRHTAIYVGQGRVVSHGRQGDPSLLSLTLSWSTAELERLGLSLNQARRYIR
jgi:cell wall-associated NlpC family hydrolase